VLIVLAAVAEAASGHAASTPLPMAATASFAVHLAAVGVWVFALLAAVAGSEPVVTTLKRFTRPAVAAAVVVALTARRTPCWSWPSPGSSSPPPTA
jgi:putative copper export protein